jgi:hypothetical protein
MQATREGSGPPRPYLRFIQLSRHRPQSTRTQVQHASNHGRIRASTAYSQSGTDLQSTWTQVQHASNQGSIWASTAYSQSGTDLNPLGPKHSMQATREGSGPSLHTVKQAQTSIHSDPSAACKQPGKDPGLHCIQSSRHRRSSHSDPSTSCKQPRKDRGLHCIQSIRHRPQSTRTQAQHASNLGRIRAFTAYSQAGIYLNPLGPKHSMQATTEGSGPPRPYVRSEPSRLHTVKQAHTSIHSDPSTACKQPGKDPGLHCIKSSRHRPQSTRTQVQHASNQGRIRASTACSQAGTDLNPLRPKYSMQATREGSGPPLHAVKQAQTSIHSDLSTACKQPGKDAGLHFIQSSRHRPQSTPTQAQHASNQGRMRAYTTLSKIRKVLARRDQVLRTCKRHLLNMSHLSSLNIQDCGAEAARMYSTKPRLQGPASCSPPTHRSSLQIMPHSPTNLDHPAYSVNI